MSDTTQTTDRYTIHAILDGEAGLYATAPDLDTALDKIKEAFALGATYAYQRDTRPDEYKPQVVTAAMKANLEAINPMAKKQGYETS